MTTLTNPISRLTLPAQPSHAEFVAIKSALLSAVRDFVDVSETRMARVLVPQLTDSATLELPAAGHRCHVAEQWLDCFGLPAQWKSRAVITQGVRQSLSALFAYWAATGAQVLIPADTYPVYVELARAAGCPFRTYQTFPEVDFSELQASSSTIDVLLLPLPLKPRGGLLNSVEQRKLFAWLHSGINRRLVLDTVYNFDTRLQQLTRALFAFDQTIVLHSLSKAWARPLVTGVALLPAQDEAKLAPVLRSLSVDRENLRLGQALLTHDQEQPARLKSYLKILQSELATVLADHAVAASAVQNTDEPGQYLFVVPLDWRELLNRHLLLALPLSVFGSPVPGYSVVSSLPALT
jgi:histidinol-phosphate/aromatic aminotransferase/cobyric acid decarboxylase-like protein